MQRLTLPGEFPGFNEYLKELNRNRYEGNKIKKEQTEWVAWEARSQKIKPVQPATHIIYHWYCKNRKRDKDNIAFAKKFINDGLQVAGVLSNDGWKNILAFSDEFHVDADRPRIEVEIYG